MVNELEYTAEWRSGKAAQYPNDARNAEAAKIAGKIADELRSFNGDEKSAYDSIYEFMFHDGDKNSEDRCARTCERWSEYRSRIGFDYFPSSAREYLSDLIRIALEEAPDADYVINRQRGGRPGS